MSLHKFEIAEDNINADSKQPKHRVYFWRQVLASISSLLATACIGITFSFTGTFLPTISEYINDEEGSWLASMNIFLMIFGTMLSWFLVRRLGNNTCMSVMCVIWILGWICLSVATSFIIFLIGCMVVGFASGFNNNIAMTYLIEMPEPKLRGTLTMVSTAFSYFGSLLGHLVSIVVPRSTAMLLCAIGPLLTLMAIYWSPESPYWLLHKNEKEAAKKNFFWLRGESAESQKDFQLILSNQSEFNVEQGQGMLKNIFTRAFFLPLYISLLMFTLVTGSGIDVILLYAEEVISELSPGNNAHLVIVLMDSIAVIFCIVSSCVVRIIPRRSLLFSTSIGCALSLLGIILAKMYNLPNIILVLFICSYMAILSLGMGPVVWLVPAEIFPEVTRDVGIGASTMYYYFLTFLFVKIIPTMKASLSIVTVLWIFIGTVSICSILLYFVMPETKDITLEEVENQMHRRKFFQFKLRRQRKT